MDEFATKATGSSAIRVSRVRRVPTLRAETSRARAEATRSRVLCAHAGMCWLLPSSPTSPLFLLLQRRSRRVPAVPPLPERETEHPAPLCARPGPQRLGGSAQALHLGRKMFKEKKPRTGTPRTLGVRLSASCSCSSRPVPALSCHATCASSESGPNVRVEAFENLRRHRSFRPFAVAARARREPQTRDIS